MKNQKYEEMLKLSVDTGSSWTEICRIQNVSYSTFLFYLNKTRNREEIENLKLLRRKNRKNNPAILYKPRLSQSEIVKMEKKLKDVESEKGEKFKKIFVDFMLGLSLREACRKNSSNERWFMMWLEQQCDEVKEFLHKNHEGKIEKAIEYIKQTGCTFAEATKKFKVSYSYFYCYLKKTMTKKEVEELKSYKEKEKEKRIENAIKRVSTHNVSITRALKYYGVSSHDFMAYVKANNIHNEVMEKSRKAVYADLKKATNYLLENDLTKAEVCRTFNINYQRLQRYIDRNCTNEQKRLIKDGRGLGSPCRKQNEKIGYIVDNKANRNLTLKHIIEKSHNNKIKSRILLDILCSHNSQQSVSWWKEKLLNKGIKVVE